MVQRRDRPVMQVRRGSPDPIQLTRLVLAGRLPNYRFRVHAGLLLLGNPVVLEGPLLQTMQQRSNRVWERLIADQLAETVRAVRIGSHFDQRQKPVLMAARARL